LPLYGFDVAKLVNSSLNPKETFMRILAPVLILFCFCVSTQSQPKIWIEKLVEANVNFYTTPESIARYAHTEIEDFTITQRSGDMRVIVDLMPNIYPDYALPSAYIYNNYLLGVVRVRNTGKEKAISGTIGLKYVVTDGVTKEYVSQIIVYGRSGISPGYHVDDKLSPYVPNRHHMIFPSRFGQSEFYFNNHSTVNDNQMFTITGTFKVTAESETERGGRANSSTSRTVNQ
jgi:hypothetical protein